MVRSAMMEGIEVAGPLDDAGQECALGQVELAHVLAEVDLRCLAEAVDGEAAALAQRNLVGVHLEDLLLVEAVFELEGNDDLRDLVPNGACVGDDEQLGQLHGQGGGSAAMLAVANHIVPGPTGDAEVVHAAVLEEAAILDGQNGLDQVRRNLVVGEQAALGAVGIVAEAGDEQRLQLIAGKRLAMIVGDRIHDAVG